MGGKFKWHLKKLCYLLMVILIRLCLNRAKIVPTFTNLLKNSSILLY